MCLLVGAREWDVCIYHARVAHICSNTHQVGAKSFVPNMYRLFAFHLALFPGSIPKSLI